MVFRPRKTQDLKGEPIHGLNQTKIGLIDRKTFNANLREFAALRLNICSVRVVSPVTFEILSVFETQSSHEWVEMKTV
jgi:hypothetical protein